MKAKYLGAKKAARVKKLAKTLKKKGLTLDELARKQKQSKIEILKDHIKRAFKKIQTPKNKNQ